jgi:hypothetical protein
MKKTISMLSLLVVMFSVFAANKSALTGDPVLSVKEKAASVEFKSLQGSDRLTQFKSLQKTIIMNDGAFRQSISMGFSPSTETTITFLLGTPDEILEGGFWVYNLKTNTSQCKVVLGFNKTAQVIFYAIKDCQ